MKPAEKDEDDQIFMVTPFVHVRHEGGCSVGAWSGCCASAPSDGKVAEAQAAPAPDATAPASGADAPKAADAPADAPKPKKKKVLLPSLGEARGRLQRGCLEWVLRVRSF